MRKTIEKRVHHFSGGRSSGLALLIAYRPGDVVIFCDTGREHEDTYRFVDDFEQCTGIEIIRLTGDFQKEVIIKEQMVPNRWKRKCTLNLKIKKARRYLRAKGWFTYTQFIGFRFDEPDRYKTYSSWKAVTTIFPLVEARISKPDVMSFWENIPWKLRIAAILGNCDGCFQKGKAALIAIFQAEPWRADKWIDDEENREVNPKGYTYFSDVTMRQLRDQALSLKKIYDLAEMTPEFSCSCTA